MTWSSDSWWQNVLDIHSNASWDVESISYQPLYKLARVCRYSHTDIVNSVNEWNKFSPEDLSCAHWMQRENKALTPVTFFPPFWCNVPDLRRDYLYALWCLHFSQLNQKPFRRSARRWSRNTSNSGLSEEIVSWRIFGCRVGLWVLILTKALTLSIICMWKLRSSFLACICAISRWKPSKSRQLLNAIIHYQKIRNVCSYCVGTMQSLSSES